MFIVKYNYIDIILSEIYINNTTLSIVMKRKEEVKGKCLFDRMVATPHSPTLNIIDDENKRKWLRVTVNGNVFHTTDEQVYAKKVGKFCYAEEDFFYYLREKFPHLNSAELDTKILRAIHPLLNFDAYSFDPIGLGLNIDGLTRISGRLYKLQRGKDGLH